MQSACEECNFHIFYQLLNASDMVKQRLRLHESKRPWRLVEGKLATSRPQETCSFEELDRHLMKLIGDKLVVLDIYSILSGVIHLGQLTFNKTPTECDATEISSPDCIVRDCAYLLGFINKESCNMSIEHRNMSATVAEFDIDGMEHMVTLLTQRSIDLPASAAPVTIPYTDIAQAVASRDAIGREIYRRLFGWIVERINSSCGADSAVAATLPDSSPGVIALLDIFGFENFEENYFDQLCINYANEKLQEMFAADIIESVRNEYKNEGLDLSSIGGYPSYSEVVQLIEHPVRGILSCINDQCRLPRGNDRTFLQRVGQLYQQAEHNNHASELLVMDVLKGSRYCSFGIHHFAGTVFYCAEGFVEINRDQYPSQLDDVLSSKAGGNQLLQQLFSRKCSDDLKLSTKVRGPISVGLQFKLQLNHLLESIRKTEIQYIRCLKPNNDHSHNIFDDALVSSQLVNGGLIAAIELGRSAFPCKLPIASFLRDFNFMDCPRTDFFQSSFDFSSESVGRSQCIEVMDGLSEIIKEISSAGSYSVGKNHIYFRRGVLAAIRNFRTKYLLATKRVQLQWKRFQKAKVQREEAERMKYLVRKHAAANIKQCWSLYRKRKHRRDDSDNNSSTEELKQGNGQESVSLRVQDNRFFHSMEPVKRTSFVTLRSARLDLVARLDRRERGVETMVSKSSFLWKRNAIWSRHKDICKKIIVFCLFVMTLYATFIG